MTYVEVNCDTLAGPTHHFGGYATGNLSCMAHQGQISSPKQAALQGLNKMRRLMELGIPQIVLPPRSRPAFDVLRTLGFKGTDEEIQREAATKSPELFGRLSSSSAMWAANYATVSPSPDTADGKLHLTVANLHTHFHRAIEAQETYTLFQRLFHNKTHFVLHPPLPSGSDFGDEGAANHTRLCTDYGAPGVHLFVYGKSAFETRESRFPIRQAKEASEAIARQQGLDPQRVFFLPQNPALVDEGVFHSDLVMVGNKNLLLLHEKAFTDPAPLFAALKKLLPVEILCVSETQLPLKQALATYFFNSQLVTLPDGSPLLLAPQECASLDLSWLPLPIEFIDLRESMCNGGGPACLRLRLVMNEEQKKSLDPRLFLTPQRYEELAKKIEREYPDHFQLVAPILLD